MQGNERFLIGGGAASIEGGGSATSIEGGGRAASIEGLRPYEDWLRQYFYPLPIPNKKRTSHMRGSYALPEFVPLNPSFSICRNENESLFYPKRSEAIK